MPPIPKLKIIILGKSSVGKTCLMDRFCDDIFDEYRHNYSPRPYDIKCKQHVHNQENFELQIWDTAGLEKYQALSGNYLHNVHGAVIVYDITNRDSFNDVTSYVRLLENYYIKDDSSYPVLAVVGTKLDKALEEGYRNIDHDEGRTLAQRQRALFMETSAKSNHNVTQLFEDLVLKIIQTPGLWQAEDGDIVDLLKSNSLKFANQKETKTCASSLKCKQG